MTVRDWNRHTILAELRSRGMTLAGLAETYSLSHSGVMHIWKRENEKVERAIALYLDVPVEVLFPKRYPKRGNRIFNSYKITPKPQEASKAA